MVGILLDILVNVVIFYIIYSAINRDVDYFKNVLIYAIGMEIELFIVMLFLGFISILMLIMVFGAYFILGLIWTPESWDKSANDSVSQLNEQSESADRYIAVDIQFDCKRMWVVQEAISNSN